MDLYIHKQRKWLLHSLSLAGDARAFYQWGGERLWLMLWTKSQTPSPFVQGPNPAWRKEAPLDCFHSKAMPRGGMCMRTNLSFGPGNINHTSPGPWCIPHLRLGPGPPGEVTVLQQSRSPKTPPVPWAALSPPCCWRQREVTFCRAACHSPVSLSDQATYVQKTEFMSAARCFQPEDSVWFVYSSA